MSSSRPGNPSITKLYDTTAQAFKNNPLLFAPFIGLFIVELLSVIIVYLSPRVPVNLVMAYPIRKFWGERFLHYPLNFLLLPKLASLSKMAVNVIAGSLLSGMAVAMIGDIHKRSRTGLRSSFKSSLKKYLKLAVVVLASTLLFYFSLKLIASSLLHYFLAGNTRLLFFGIGAWMGPGMLAANFFLWILIRAAFVYAVPALILDNANPVEAILRSGSVFKRLFRETIVLVGLPMLISVPSLLLQYNSAFLVDQFFPESVLLVLLFGAMINSLVIAPLITSSTAFLYLAYKEK